MNRTIITVMGKDMVGIIAAVCTYLANHSINILDIDQSILQEFLHMMMIVDINKADRSFNEIVADLDELGKSIGVQIKVQREEIFDIMHRI